MSDEWRDEWSEQDEFPEALLNQMQQEDQEKRSTTNGSSRSDNVMGDKEEKDLIDYFDGVQEVDLKQIDWDHEEVLFEGVSTESDSAPSEAEAQEMSSGISKPVVCCKFNLRQRT